MLPLASTVPPGEPAAELRISTMSGWVGPVPLSFRSTWSSPPVRPAVKVWARLCVFWIWRLAPSPLGCCWSSVPARAVPGRATHAAHAPATAALINFIPTISPLVARRLMDREYMHGCVTGLRGRSGPPVILRDTVAAIETQQLAREFEGGIVAVDGVDLEVAEGEIYGFLGPNGAGKTTTVRMLTTLLQPTDGRARVAGYDVVEEAADVRRAIGVALQEAALDPLMTGRELMRLSAVLHGLGRQAGQEKADALLERVDLVEAADRQVGTYSGGMRRRLDLASALVHEPRVLFLDEPTTGLDPVSRRTIWEEVEQLNGEGTTVFLTTQYLEEADKLANRVGIIDFGRIVAEDTPGRLKAQIGHPHLEVKLLDGGLERAKEIVRRFGNPLPSKDGAVLVELPGGASEVAPVVRALDEAGLTVEALDLVEPSLDDVFVEKTGHHLEPDEPDTGEIE